MHDLKYIGYWYNGVYYVDCIKVFVFYQLYCCVIHAQTIEQGP